MGSVHTLQVSIQAEKVRVGNNPLQVLVYNNDPALDYEQVIVRLTAPPGIELRPTKLKVSPLRAHSKDLVPIKLYAARPGTYEIKIEANTFPAPPQGFLDTTQRLDILAQPDTPKSIIETILDDMTNDESIPVENDFSDTLSDFERKSLQKRLQNLFEEHEAVTEQWGQSLDAGNRLRIDRKIKGLEREIREIQGKLDQIPSHSKSGDFQNGNDIYSKYETGLSYLKRHIKRSHSRYGEFLSYEQRLMENITQSRRFGDTEARRAERVEVVERINELTLSVLNITFNELYL